MKDLIIGSITKLGWDSCSHWVNSINKSRFIGDKIICVFGQNDYLIEKFKENNFQVHLFRDLQPNENICVTRFFVYYSILKDIQTRYRTVIATDVTDVIFQSNPSEFFTHLNNEEYIIASSENVRYKDEIWGSNNMRLSFGDAILDRVKDNVIYNAGVIAGSHNLIQDLFLSIYTCCEGRPQNVPGGGGPDQAAYNYLLSMMPYSLVTKFINHDLGWACQAGTTADLRKPYENVSVDKLPKLLYNTIKTSQDKDYVIVHQYNRNAEWNKIMKERFENV